jgi:hypothetical protein
MSELNVKSTTIEKGLDLLKDFLGKAIGPAVGELGMMWADTFRLRRLKNQLAIFDRAKMLVDKNNISIRQIDLKALAPLLEHAALEEDHTLQQMWASLFVNYIDAQKNLLTHVYPRILGELSSNEVRLLIEVSQGGGDLHLPFRGKNQHNVEFTVEEICNLQRLGLISPYDDLDIYDYEDEQSYINSNPIPRYYLNALAKGLLNACKR